MLIIIEGGEQILTMITTTYYKPMKMTSKHTEVALSTTLLIERKSCKIGNESHKISWVILTTLQTNTITTNHKSTSQNSLNHTKCYTQYYNCQKKHYHTLWFTNTLLYICSTKLNHSIYIPFQWTSLLTCISMVKPRMKLWTKEK